MQRAYKKSKIPLSEKEMQAVETILKTWGAFTLLEYGGNLNFLSENILQNLSRFGIKIAGGRKEIRWPAIAEHADQLIRKLNQYKPKWAQAIKWHYTESDSVRQQAGRHHLRKSTYHEQLINGRTWIAEQLQNALHE